MAIVPIQPELIKWARENRGLDALSASEVTGIPLDVWNALESGEEQPNKSHYKAIRDKLDIPSATLFRRTAPSIDQMPESFRTIDSRDPNISLQTRFAVDFARTVAAQFTNLLEDEVVEPMPRLPRIRMELDPADQGETERRRLGLSHASQMAWDKEQRFRNWRSVIESAGCFVLLQKFPYDDCKGFALYDTPDAPIIVLNKNEPTDGGKIFSLIHEYAHLLLREPGFSDRNEQNSVEWYCNRFAEGFLMPRAMIREVLGTLPDGPRQWDSSEIVNLANKIGVSQQALALRFENMGIATKGFFEWFKDQQPKREKRSGSSKGGNHNNTALSELGYRFAGTILNAEKLEAIPDFEAYELLNIAPKYFSKIREIIDAQSERVPT